MEKIPAEGLLVKIMKYMDIVSPIKVLSKMYLKVKYQMN